MIARVLVAMVFAAAAFIAPAQAQTPGQRAPVVVELYTSQGCTQCPRANRLLGTFARVDGVLALTFAVGIWDYLGWSDTFAEPAFSERQRVYSRSLRVRGRFTPQLVINGAPQMSASDWDAARATLDAVRAAPPLEGVPEVSITRMRNNSVRVTVGASTRFNGADIWLLSFDPGPITVLVTGGVNFNRTITHYNVVHTIDRLGPVTSSESWFERTHCTPQCAVLVQEPNGGRILAAAYTQRRPH